MSKESNNRCVYVSGFPSDVSVEDLKSKFSEFGTVEDARIPNSQRSRYGFVTFETREGAQKAVDEGNGIEWNKEKLTVEFAKTQQKSNARRRERSRRDRDSSESSDSDAGRRRRRRREPSSSDSSDGESSRRRRRRRRDRRDSDSDYDYEASRRSRRSRDKDRDRRDRGRKRTSSRRRYSSSGYSSD